MHCFKPNLVPNGHCYVHLFIVATTILNVSTSLHSGDYRDIIRVDILLKVITSNPSFTLTVPTLDSV